MLEAYSFLENRRNQLLKTFFFPLPPFPPIERICICMCICVCVWVCVCLKKRERGRMSEREAELPKARPTPAPAACKVPQAVPVHVPAYYRGPLWIHHPPQKHIHTHGSVVGFWRGSGNTMHTVSSWKFFDCGFRRTEKIKGRQSEILMTCRPGNWLISVANWRQRGWGQILGGTPGPCGY